MATKTNMTINRGGKEYNYYKITRTIGHKWENGKKVPEKKQFYGKSKTAAEKAFRQYQEEQLKQKYLQENQITEAQYKTFGVYAEEFRDNVFFNSSLKINTQSAYDSAYRNHIKDSYLSSMPICEISENVLLDYYDYLQVNRSTFGNITGWMKNFYKWIARSGIGQNITASLDDVPVKPENKRSNTIVVWEPNEVEKILSGSIDTEAELLVYVLYYTGFRISECLGLMAEDFDLINDTVSVNREAYNKQILTPKAKSYRTIPLHRKLKEIFLKHNIQKGYLFAGKDGKPIAYESARRKLNRLYKKIDVQQKRIHAYRATFCTELCRREVPIEVVSKLMGHKSIMVTAKYYAFIKKDSMTNAISKL